MHKSELASRLSTVVGIVALSASLSCSGRRESPAPTDHPTFPVAQSFLQGDRIFMVPGGPSFQLPDSWLNRYEKDHGNLQMDAADLAGVRDGWGEWQEEQGQIVNAVMPFQAVVFHGSAEGWGKGATSRWFSLHMRAYVVDVPVKAQIEEAVRARFPYATVSDSSTGEWRRLSSPSHPTVTVRLGVSYHDYGGTIIVEFYSRACEDRPVTLAFMRTEWPDEPAMEARQIIASFRCRD